MKPIDSNLLQKFLRLAADRLQGQWVVLGGSVLPLVGINGRVTVDIDIAGPADADQRQTLILMEIAESLGLPVEAINQAAAYFLFKIKGWEDSLVEIRRGKTAIILRPDINLFIKLKCGRLSETDLHDCRAMLDYARNSAEPIDTRGILKHIDRAIGGETNQVKLQRLRDLRKDL